jgi:hypothetical protein
MDGKLSRVQAIKTFFESDGGRKMENREIMSLSGEEREEIGNLCGKALGVEIVSLTPGK